MYVKLTLFHAPNYCQTYSEVCNINQHTCTAVLETKLKLIIFTVYIN